MTSTQNINEVSYIRVVAMLLVVAFHCLCYYTTRWQFNEMQIELYGYVATFLNSIHLPLFVFVSGYLYAFLVFNKGKYSKTMPFITNKFKRLLLPYIFWAILLILVFPDLYDFDWAFRGLSHLWFLMMLFNVFIIAHMSKRLWTASNPAADLLLYAVLLILYFAPIGKTRYLCFSHTIQYLPMFFTGLLFAKYEHKHLTFNVLPPPKRFKTLRGWGLALLLILQAIFAVYGSALVANHGRIENFIRYMLSIAICVMVMLFLKTSTRTVGEKFQNIVTSLDRYGMGIYLIHHILLISALQFDMVRNCFNEHYIVCPIIAFILVFFISWYLSMIILKSRLSWILG